MEYFDVSLGSVCIKGSICIIQGNRYFSFSILKRSKRGYFFCPVRLKLIYVERDSFVLANNDTFFCPFPLLSHQGSTFKFWRFIIYVHWCLCGSLLWFPHLLHFFSRFNGKEDVSYCLLVILTGPFTFPQRNYTTKRKTFPFKLRSSVTRSHLSGCLMSFCSKILGGGGDLWIIILLKNECSFSGGDMWGGGGTQPLKDDKKIELCTLRGGGDVKVF